MPLLAPALILNSSCNSKAPNSFSVMMSPPPPLASTVSSPLAMDHPCAGKPSLSTLRQPWEVLPSHNNRQPCSFLPPPGRPGPEGFAPLVAPPANFDRPLGRGFVLPGKNPAAPPPLEVR